MKVLITGGKSALALKMLKAFAQYQVILADYGEMPDFPSTTCKFVSLGEKNEEILAHNLLNHCLDEEIDLVLPLHAFEIVAIAKAKTLFGEFNIDVLLPNDHDMPHYLNASGSEKPKKWAVFMNGNVLFQSFTAEEGVAVAESSTLSGAFYINEVQSVANLTLITI
ncbi:MAG: hypothetical protein EOO07_31615 [Chitinophagaceae bacterium]|nr:MAG: hypothetical protein EOO07_31615 [Chitinophagaceae bacterium]